MPETRPSDLLATLADLCASVEPSADPLEGFHPCLRALSEGLSLSGAALWGVGADGLTLLAQHGLPPAWPEKAARLKADAPVAIEASRGRGVTILPGAPGLPPLPGLAPVAAAVPLRVGTRTVGLLVALGAKPKIFGKAVRDLLAAAARILAGTLAFAQQLRMENARLYHHLKDYSAGLEEKVRERTAALEAANLELTEANRHKSAFLANMSHELRTPLNSIIGFSEVLEDGTFGPLTERQRFYVQNILSSGEHLLSLITDILDLSKIEAGKMELRLSRFPVGEDLAEAVEVIRGQAMGKSITLTLEADATLPVLTADPGKFRQICLNLLSNAVKFTPDGGRVSVTARVASLEGPRGPIPAVEVAVADTGIGIEAADQERIFREFEQVDGSYARKYAGTGLGLALTRKLVELHGGAIRVESAGAGRGSTFRVRLPLRPPVLEGEILVVDDDAELLQGLTETLARLGYGVRVARDGEEALAAVAAARPDCLILDLHLPRRSGLQVLRALREQSRTREVPVLALTGWGEQEGREALRLGAQEFLTKPVSSSILAATVDRLLQKAARERRR